MAFSPVLFYHIGTLWGGGEGLHLDQATPHTMDKPGAMSTQGKVSGLKPPSKIVRPSGVPTKTSPSSGKIILKYS